MNKIEKYDHKKISDEIREILKDKKFYEYDKNHKGKPFSIILPPPNITGKLHLGHALDASLQDAIIRYKHLQGYNTLWISGLDHASIATQAKFEKILKETTGKTRLDYSRSQFLKMLNEWALEQANAIKGQWSKLNLALSLDSLCFTMDEHVNKAVNDFFVNEYKKGNIYQDLKLVNWDTILNTAISDIEINYKEVNSKMYYFKYYIEGSKEYLIVATTRPETMFGDTCLVINPKDERYKKYVNKKVINPVNNEVLPIITDEYVALDFGTGVMKCTPAHDFNDYALAKKHNMLNYHSIFNYDGTLNEKAIDFNKKNYSGIKISVARKLVVDLLKESDLLIKIEDIKNNIAYSDRSNSVVEPMLSKQWFMKMNEIAKKISNLQKNNKNIKFFPSRFNDTLLTWMNNIQDWCISRQLWWGHQLPVWYHNKTKEVYVDVIPPKDEQNWTRDTDVLDTWYSSGLWAIVTTFLNNKEYAKFFPISTMITAYDILFFWVSRMISMTYMQIDQKPFDHVLIHGLIRDSQGRKMSKSLNNGIDPLELVEKYGPDALKLFFTSSSSMGEDIRYNEEKIKYFSTFLNKIWNSYQLLKLNKKISFDNYKLINPSLFDLHILSKISLLQKQIFNLYDKYEFTVANKMLIESFWNEFCNQYLEFIKINLWSENEKVKHDQINNSLFIFQMYLKMLYPICPDICDWIYYDITNDFIWNHTNEICNSEKTYNYELVETFANIFSVLKTYRIKKSLSNKKNLDVKFFTNSEIHIEKCKKMLAPFNVTIDFINKNLDNDKNFEKFPVLNGILFIQNEYNDGKDSQKNIEEKLKKLEFEINRSKTILSNKSFVQKAPKEKVELEQKKLEKYIEERDLLISKNNK